MMDALMYLAEQRGKTQSPTHRSFHTLNFGAYQTEIRKPFLSLNAFNDETLMPRSGINYPVASTQLVLLLPVIGAIEYGLISGGGRRFVDVGESVTIPISAGEILAISNPFESEPVNFLTAWFASDELAPERERVHHFDVDLSLNALIRVVSTGSLNMFAGKFTGRSEGSLPMGAFSRGAFIFVVEGVFEIQDRLLQQRDGLGIGGTHNLEFECLSNEGILLVLEIK